MFKADDFICRFCHALDHYLGIVKSNKKAQSTLISVILCFSFVFFGPHCLILMTLAWRRFFIY